MTTPVILVVEDVPLNMLLIVSVLNAMLPEASILEANNGEKALEIAERIKTDLIIMDIQMPVMDGLEATRRIRHHESRQGIQKPVPIVALTAYTLDREREKCMTAGMNDFLTKPINLEMLRKMITRYLDTDIQQPAITEASMAQTKSIHFDLQGLIERTQVEEALLIGLAKQGAKELTAQMQFLHNAISGANPDQVKKASHTIKGVGLNLGFSVLAKMAKHMEALAEEDPDNVSAHFQQMEQEVLIVQKMLLGPDSSKNN